MARACSASSRANRIAIACRSSPASPPTQLSGWLAPVSPRMSARAAMPWRNSSGKVARDSSGTPSARRPFQVNASVTHRFVLSIVAGAVAADSTMGISSDSHARPPAGLSNDRNS